MASTVTPLPTAEPARCYTRRSVLRGLGIGSATAVVAGTALLSYRVYDTAVLDPGSGPAHDPWRRWRDTPGPLGAVAAAVLAASPHNTQPWAFALGTDSIDVFTDPTRTTGSVDPFSRERYIGLGCALENLVLACGPRGLQPDASLLPDGPDGERVAHVQLSPAPPSTSPLYEVIDQRHTNRGPFQPVPVPTDTLTGLSNPVDANDLAVQWIVEPGPKATLGRLLVDAAEALVADEEQSLDNFAWFRPDNDDEQRHRDGLVLDGQGLSPFTLGIAKLLPPLSRTAGDRFWVDKTRDVHTPPRRRTE